MIPSRDYSPRSKTTSPHNLSGQGKPSLLAYLCHIRTTGYTNHVNDLQCIPSYPSQIFDSYYSAAAETFQIRASKSGHISSLQMESTPVESSLLGSSRILYQLTSPLVHCYFSRKTTFPNITHASLRVSFPKLIDMTLLIKHFASLPITAIHAFPSLDLSKRQLHECELMAPGPKTSCYSAASCNSSTVDNARQPCSL